MAPIVNSATALALRPGALTTATPRARAAFMSMFTGPPRETPISFSSGQRSSSQPFTGARWVTRISASARKSTMSSGLPMNSFSPSSASPA
jgi:hypothetical protein